jgi:hypothetical protein
MVHIKTITESGDTGCDLVELDTLLAAICRRVSTTDIAPGAAHHIPRLRTNIVKEGRLRICGVRTSSREEVFLLKARQDALKDDDQSIVVS